MKHCIESMACGFNLTTWEIKFLQLYYSGAHTISHKVICRSNLDISDVIILELVQYDFQLCKSMLHVLALLQCIVKTLPHRLCLISFPELLV